MLVPLLLLLTAQPPDYVSQFDRALRAYDAGRFDEAAALFEVAGEGAPDAPVWRVHAAAALLRLGEPVLAAAHVRAALRRGYPLSDLRAIDVHLVPRERIAPDLAPEGARPVTCFGTDGSLEPMTGRFEGDVYIHGGQAWDLVRGALVATRRDADWTVIGYAVHPDGSRDEVRVPHARRWDHVDGRVLDWKSTGQTTAHSALLEPVAYLDTNARDRGFRLGLWCAGLIHSSSPRAIGDGRSLGFAIRRDSATEHFALDLGTLALTAGADAARQSREWWGARHVQPADRDAIAEALGESLRIDDDVLFLGDGPLAVVLRLWGFAVGESVLVILDPEAKRVVARPQMSVGPGAYPSVRDITLAARGSVLIIPDEAGEQLVAYSTETWDRLWYVPHDAGSRRPVNVRASGGLVFIGDDSFAACAVYDARTGERQPGIEGSPVGVIDTLEHGRLLLGRNWGELVLMDGEDGSTILFLWFDMLPDGDLRTHAVGVDGTYAVPARALREGHFLHGGRFVPAAELAPWLWDPLHVRSLVGDTDRSPRRAPVGR